MADASVTLLIEQISAGDSAAAARLLPLVYDELRRLAASRMAREAADHTLQPTALVHEAYLRLIGSEGQPVVWSSRVHFFAAAAEAMRRILIDPARAKRADKRGGTRRKLRLDPDGFCASEVPDEVIDLDEALGRFQQEDETKAQLVRLRFFAGLSLDEAAAALGISSTTADRYWAYARAWLYDALRATDRFDST